MQSRLSMPAAMLLITGVHRGLRGRKLVVVDPGFGGPTRSRRGNLCSSFRWDPGFFANDAQACGQAVCAADVLGDFLNLVGDSPRVRGALSTACTYAGARHAHARGRRIRLRRNVSRSASRPMRPTGTHHTPEPGDVFRGCRRQGSHSRPRRQQRRTDPRPVLAGKAEWTTYSTTDQRHKLPPSRHRHAQHARGHVLHPTSTRSALPQYSPSPGNAGGAIGFFGCGPLASRIAEQSAS